MVALTFVVRPVLRAAAAIVRRLSDRGWRKGIEGNGGWLAVGMVVAGARLIRRLSTRSRDVVYRGTVTPGTTLTIDHLREDRAGRTRSR